MRYEKWLELYKYLSTGDVSRSELESYADKYKNESGILEKICQHPKVTGKLLKKIYSGSKSFSVLESATSSPKFPSVMMIGAYEKAIKLSYKENNRRIKHAGGMTLDSSVGVRRNLAVNPKCPKRLLDILADYPDIDMKVSVAANPNVSKETAMRLKKIRSKKIATALQANHVLAFD